MSKQVKYSTAMDNQVEEWLKAKGIEPSEVSADYVITRDRGLTLLTLTFYTSDFPLPATEPVSRETNRPHLTCIDVTTSAEKPYSSWVCGPDCPTDKNPKDCTCTPGDHLPYRFRCPANIVNPDETPQQ